MSDLKRCPCGETPSSLCVDGDDHSKWMFVSGDCCGEWSIEFRSDYLYHGDAELQHLAKKAWNEAPRGGKL